MLLEKIIKLNKSITLHNNSFDFFVIKKDNEIKEHFEENFSSNLTHLVHNILTDKLYQETYLCSTPKEVFISNESVLLLHLKTFTSKSNLKNIHYSYIQKDDVITQGFLLQHIDDEQILIIVPKDKDKLFEPLICSSSSEKKDISSEEDLLKHFHLPIIDCSIEHLFPYEVPLHLIDLINKEIHNNPPIKK